LYDGDLPVILGHVAGVPVEETVMQLAAAGVMSVATIGVAAEVTVRRLRARLRRR
jgi:uncharacterized membrane protein YhaH (DUF805 family)